MIVIEGETRAVTAERFAGGGGTEERGGEGTAVGAATGARVAAFRAAAHYRNKIPIQNGGENNIFRFCSGLVSRSLCILKCSIK